MDDVMPVEALAPVRLAIVGTRILRCPGDVVSAGRMAQLAIETLRPQVVISGGAKGVDTIAEIVARCLGYTEQDGSLVLHYPAQQQFHGKGGYRDRETLIARECTHLLRLACKQAETYGSAWTANKAQELGRAVTRELVCR